MITVNNVSLDFSGQKLFSDVNLLFNAGNCYGVIGANGVEEVVELPLTAEEKQTFHECCDAIRVNMTRAAEL